jgi:Ca2+-binding RTX toxin-like protein
MRVSGSPNDDALAGSTGDDTFLLEEGGNDSAQGDAGNDRFFMGAAFGALDQINGGVGDDLVALNGDYSAGVILGATTLSSVEKITLAAGHSYGLTTNDANVAAGEVLTVSGLSLGAGDVLSFDGSAESDGSFIIRGGAGNDRITGGGGADTFNLTKGGDDSVHGGAGNDKFLPGATFNALDQFDGGAGNDQVALNGDYSAGVTLGATTLSNIETITLAAGHSYALTTNDANVAAGKVLTVSGVSLGAGETLNFDGSAESDGAFIIYGGKGADVISGGSQADYIDGAEGDNQINGLGGNDTLIGCDNVDTINGGPGNDYIIGESSADVLDGGAGSDIFEYDFVLDSTSVNFDTIIGFNANEDLFVLFPFIPSGVNTPVTLGTLSAATFDTDLATAIAADQLYPDQAVLFTPNSGDYAGKMFLIVDWNGTAGYQASQDLVIYLQAPLNMGNFDEFNFS